MASRIVSALMLGFLPAVSGNKFLHQTASKVNADVLENMLLIDLSPANQQRVASMREELRPLFDVLPKNKGGQLEPGSVRYALHRFFVHKYGWYVKGLDPEDNKDSNPISSHADILTDRVPHYIQSLFEKRMHGEGLGIDDLAVFAATLNDLMEKDAVDGFHEVFTVFNLNHSHVSENDADRVVRGFVARFLNDETEKVTSVSRISKIERDLRSAYSDWPHVVTWLQDRTRSIRWMEESRQNPFRSTPMTLATVTESVQGIMHRIVEVAAYGCSDIKEELVNLEYKGTGRVRVRDYYADESIHRESLEFLRQSGAVDDSEPQMPMILIPNLVHSKGNCIADANYYSLCCPNECESLFRHVELQLKTPMATPDRIAQIIGSLPSESIDAPRNLSSALLKRLDQIAEHHGGSVPLHGRLFTQWMHHAYPRECSYPQHEKRAAPLTQDAWISQYDLPDVLALPEAAASLRNMPDHQNAISDTNLPWVMMEELISEQASARQSSRFGVVRIVIAVVALASMAVPLVSMSRDFMGSKAANKAHMV